MNFGYCFDVAVRMWPDKECLIDGASRITYGQLEERTNRVANGLMSRGIGKGDHVAVLIKNDYRFVEAMIGALRAGATVTPATTRAHYDTLVHIMTDSAANVLFASTEFAAEASRLATEIDGLDHVFLMDAKAPDTVDYDSWLAEQSDERVETAADDAELGLISYTSGSTGVPKGVMLTHGALNYQMLIQRKALLFDTDERCLLAVPMFHAASLVSCVFPILECGASTVIQKDVDVAEMIRAIERERCTFTSGVPAMYRMMLREDELLATTDCSSLRFALCGSSEVPEDLLEEFTRRLAPMLEIYGMTENGPVCCNPRWGITKQGTTGLAYPGVELRIVDPSDPDVDVPIGEIGELLIRSPGNVSGYHNLPDVTRERLLDGGWLRSRDIARADEQGYIEIVGREDDRISCAGESIYPKEVENVLMKHPDVADVAAVAMADDLKGEVPVAFVIEKVAGRTDAEDLKQFFLANGAAYMHPRRVFMVDELPLTSARKLDRSALRVMAEEARARGAGE
jgi:acyl-CoA synthetase (AMP-forming)/AMP-acid ligase II